MKAERTSRLEQGASILRAVGVTPLLLVLTFVLCVAAILAARLRIYRVGDVILEVWTRSILLLYNIKLDVQGSEHLRAAQGVLYLFNHQSNMDIPVLVQSLRGPLRFGAKSELFRIPFFGGAMRAMGTLPIARENRDRVLELYNASIRNFSKGWNYILAPEGTRQTGPVVGPFKRGPFLFALTAQVLIVPVVIKGAAAVLPKKSLIVNGGRWSRTVRVVVLPPISTEGLREADLEQLQAEVHRRMSEEFARL